MPRQRKSYSAELKARVAMAAIKGQETINEIASRYDVHPNLVSQSKKQAQEGMAGIFSDRRTREGRDEEELRDHLYQQIGQLKVELDWLKKKSDITGSDARWLIEPEHPLISLKRQSELLGISRSTLYYAPRPVSESDIELMHLLDEQYTRTPFYGSRKMTEFLRAQGHEINRKRVRRLMSAMGLEAICPKPNTSKPVPGHVIYPYLLRGVRAERPNQIWSSDITYVRLRGGFVYLTAVIDWYSRYVLSWELSATMDAEFCVSALERALGTGTPEIFNTDQGSQFTSAAFTGTLKAAGIRISMDGRGRALDNLFVERLWRTVKYEDIYLKDYEEVRDLRSGLGVYFPFYNNELFHQSLGNKTPAAFHLK